MWFVLDFAPIEDRAPRTAAAPEIRRERRAPGGGLLAEDVEDLPELGAVGLEEARVRRGLPLPAGADGPDALGDPLHKDLPAAVERTRARLTPRKRKGASCKFQRSSGLGPTSLQSWPTSAKVPAGIDPKFGDLALNSAELIGQSRP